MCNLAREAREFLEKAHIDVKEEDAEKDIDIDAVGNKKQRARGTKMLRVRYKIFSPFKHLSYLLNDNHITHHSL